MDTIQLGLELTNPVVLMILPIAEVLWIVYFLQNPSETLLALVDDCKLLAFKEAYLLVHQSHPDATGLGVRIKVVHAML